METFCHLLEDILIIDAFGVGKESFDERFYRELIESTLEFAETRKTGHALDSNKLRLEL
jgi:hypothetical protein